MLPIDFNVGDIVFEDSGDVDLGDMSEIILYMEGDPLAGCIMLSKVHLLVPIEWRR